MPFPIRGDLPQAGSRQDQFAIHFTCNHFDMGYWDKKSGGEIDSEEVKYYPGATNKTVSLGGRVNPGNITIQRIYDRNDDHIQNRIGRLIEGVGKHPCTVTQTPYDEDGNLSPRKLVYTGTLKRVLIPEVDSEATSAAMLEVEITVSGGSPTFVT